MDQKVVVITGSSSGIGSGIAKYFAQHGYKKLVLVARRADKLKEIASECKKLGAGEVLTLSKDLHDLKVNEEVVKETVNKFGRIDVLINNIGIFNPGHLMREKPLDDFVREFNFNLFSPFALTQAALPELHKTKGNVIFISSINGKTYVPRVGTYGMTKTAIDMLARVMALEEAERGVRVNVVSPGPVATEMLWNLPGTNGKSMEEIKTMLGAGIPLKRIGETEDIGRVCHFLASDESGYVSGHDFVIDGAASLQTYIHKSE